MAIGVFTPVSAQHTRTPPAISAYETWLKEDVYWIITLEEQKEFRQLVTGDQRDRFVTDFWERRHPNPRDIRNSFKEEHYRRLAFANENFAAGIEGSKTDRGRIYVVYGPPDSISKHAQSNAQQAETWFYRHIKGIGDNIH